MAAPKTHLLRSKPPWREGLDHAMCGRKAEDCTAIIPPDDGMAAAAAAWGRARYSKPTNPPVPGNLCAVCWERLSFYGLKKWPTHPVDILNIDISVVDRRGRNALHAELLALAALAAAHPDEFRDLLEGESVMLALAGTGSRRR